LVSSDITRVPVRLAQEDGSTIELDVTAMDIVVERSNSQIPVPFRDGQRFGIDMNMPQISVALTGVLVDDEGTNVPTKGATAEFDFGSTTFQSTQNNTAQQVNLLGGRVNIPSPPNQGIVGAWLPTTRLGTTDTNAAVTNVNQIDQLFFELPVDYLTSGTGQLGAPSSPVTGMQLHLEADTGVTKTASALQAESGSASTRTSANAISQWDDQSGNARHATMSTTKRRPRLNESVFNGLPAVSFVRDGSGGGAATTVANTQALDVSFHSDLNPVQYTIFMVANGSPFYESESNGPFIQNKGSGNSGYILFHDQDNQRIQFSAYQSGGVQTISSADNSFTQNPVIITAQVSGTGSSQVMTLRMDGASVATATSLDLVEKTSGAFNIGYDGTLSGGDYVSGSISEILIYDSALSNSDILKNEAYLAKKYNIALDPEHTYYGANGALQHTHIRYVLDAQSKGTVKEPHYYLNHQRPTNLVVSGYNTSTKVVSFSSGDPREWFEAGTRNRVAKDATSAYFGTVYSITSNTITVTEMNASTAPAANDTLHIAPWRTADMQHRPDVQPVISIPVLDLFPSHYSRTYQNGNQRDEQPPLTATELFTRRVAAAIESTDSLGSSALIEDGGTSSGSVFSVKPSLGVNGLFSRLEIEQRRKIDVTNTSVQIRPNEPLKITSGPSAGSKPIMTNFTGSRAGNFTKSAGDKAQDLIGVLNNSQNFFKGNKTNAPSWLSSLENIYNNHIYNVGAARDYIHGVQIPYMSTVNRNYEVVTNNPLLFALISNAVDARLDMFAGQHNLSVGDFIEIESEMGGGIVTSVLGTHAVKSVISTSAFTIELDTSSNPLNFHMTGFRKVAPEAFNVPYVQRNFFLTTGHGTNTLDKTSVRNLTPAETPFDINQDGHRKSGIQIAIDEFNVNFNAEDRLYEFDMTMLAVDYLL